MVLGSGGADTREGVVPVDVEEGAGLMAGALPRGTEHGDRHAFLARAATYAARGAHDNVAHPLPSDRAGADGFVPIGYRTLTAGAAGVGASLPTALADDFERNATRALLGVVRCADGGPSDFLLEPMIEDESIRTAVVTRDPVAQRVGARLAALGVDVADYTPQRAVTADLGVTAPRFGVAATGSLVQDSTLEGGRGASLIPRLHLAVLPVDRLVATTADVLRAMRPSASLPTNVTFITGPSRTGDIEMILTVGVHGPVKVTIALCG
jgi:L-lactate dehydrogenase complex protein LldG